MRNVILDTNVILSGVLYGGNPKALLDAVQEEKIALYMSSSLEWEVEEKLIQKFQVRASFLETVKKIFSHAVYVIPQEKVTACKDPKDNFLLELAQASQADYLVSGDTDLLVLSSWQSTQIIRPAEAVKTLC